MFLLSYCQHSFSTGLSFLDSLLNGGLLPGEFCLIIGDNKSGKSSLCRTITRSQIRSHTTFFDNGDSDLVVLGETTYSYNNINAYCEERNLQQECFRSNVSMVYAKNNYRRKDMYQANVVIELRKYSNFSTVNVIKNRRGATGSFPVEFVNVEGECLMKEMQLNDK